ncbi:glycosyltransferase family 2 protein [Castellaniella ginsengisoli]|uniref:Glycosyltransferase family 2 protein n=1 Tax=Castellaniella ginsengisoli TaxID=546114 RepID=A0AB39D5B7_9BURK
MSMIRELVSVGIPTYNRAPLLRNALSSACAQTYKDLEIIISDNASTDAAVGDVIREFSAKDPRIKVLWQDVNKGPIQNFSSALLAASGKYFIWLADDDCWESEYIECLVMGKQYSGAALVYGSAIGVEPDGAEYSIKTKMVSHCQPVLSLLNFMRADTDEVFYGLFDVSIGKKLIPVLKPWNLPGCISEKWPILEYNFSSYCFIYGLLSRGGFYRAGDGRCVHYRGVSKAQWSRPVWGGAHVYLLLGYIGIHLKMAFRFSSAGFRVGGLAGGLLGPFVSGALFFTRLAKVLAVRKYRIMNSDK